MSFENFIVTNLKYFLYQGPGINIDQKKIKVKAANQTLKPTITQIS
jgi:hypothetical protein